MSNVRKISLGIVMLLVVFAFSTAFADVVTFNVGAESIQPTSLWSYEAFIGN